MKKLLVFLVVFAFASCNQIQIKQPLVVENIKVYNPKENLALYELQERRGTWTGVNKTNPNIIDTIGKYRVGDTIKLNIPQID